MQPQRGSCNMKLCELAIRPHCHCWPPALNDLSITLCLGPFPSSLELQQMVEICSRAPAIGECVVLWLGVAMRFHWIHDDHDNDARSVAQRLGYSCSRSLLDVITDLVAHFQLSNSPASFIWEMKREKLKLRLMWLNTEANMILCTDVIHAESYQIRNYLKKARLHFRSIQTERGLNRFHLVVFLWYRMQCVSTFYVCICCCLKPQQAEGYVI